MSIRVTAMVWESFQLEGIQLLLLLALADHCSDQGSCYPSIERLARKIRRSSRQTMRVLGALETAGYLTILRNSGVGNHYQLNLDKLTATSDTAMSGVVNVTSDTAMSPPPVTQLCQGSGDIAVSPESSCNRHVNRHTGVRAADDFLPSAEQQAAILFAGRNGHDGEKTLAAVGWTLPTDELRVACIAFLDAIPTRVPGKKSMGKRKQWIAALTEHIEDYGTVALPALYKRAGEICQKLTITWPGGLTNTLPRAEQELAHPVKQQGYQL